MDDAREWLATARAPGAPGGAVIQPGDPWGAPMGSRLAADVEPGAGPSAVRPGGVWARALALTVDLCVVGGLLLGATLARALGVAAPRLFLVSEAMAVTWSLFAPSAYFVLAHGTAGQTVGKWLLGLRVVDRDGAAIGYAHALGRYVATLAAAAPAGLGLVVAAFRRDRRGLHDLLAGTRVVRVA